jgi:predicted metal-dependent phosphoesterase TrpH
MYRLDLHTHSSASPDGGIKPDQYRQLLEKGIVDYVAVTDHNQIDAALELHKEFGEHVIVGEEIMTTKGELVGLFLTKRVAPGQSPLKTAEAIKAQGGLVYVPHPFETARSGLQEVDLKPIAKLVDIMETHNGRAIPVIQDRSSIAVTWALENGTYVAASSDAHGMKGVGHTYTTIKEPFTSPSTIKVLQEAHLVSALPPLHSLLQPKYNRLSKKVRKADA